MKKNNSNVKYTLEMYYGKQLPGHLRRAYRIRNLALEPPLRSIFDTWSDPLYRNAPLQDRIKRANEINQYNAKSKEGRQEPYIITEEDVKMIEFLIDSDPILYKASAIVYHDWKYRINLPLTKVERLDS